MPNLQLSLRTRYSGSYIATDTDAAAYITAVEAADGQSLENSVRVAYDNFFIGTKADGDYSKLNNTRILGGARTLAGALVPLKPAMTAWTNVGFVAGDYSRTLGLKGNGSNKYLDTNVLNNVAPLNDSHLLTYITEARPTAGCYMGAGGGTNQQRHFGFNSSTTIFVRGTSGAVSFPTVDATGLIGYTRSIDTSFRVFTGSSSTVITRASNDGPGVSLYVFARNNDGTADLYSDARIIFASDGTANSTALQGRLDTLKAALGAL